jgi:light-regulated signal transduction histidine kinase (bacteriophytochrome)
MLQCNNDNDLLLQEFEALRRRCARLEEEKAALEQHLEQLVAKRTADLEAANKELETFAYSVSHDLRAPLRVIDGFSRILLEDYVPQESEEAREYLRSVRENVLQMGQLIDDLLAFSRLDSLSLQKQTVTHDPLIAQCLHDLQAEQEGRRVEILIGDLPQAQADPALLKQVWINLLSNALKYTRRREVGQIEVGCQSAEHRMRPEVYFVKDNGVGFDMQYAHRLFGVFQRLHRQEEYEGTGVGLAIVQHIIHRHGGRVWAEAQPNQGATFYFTL